MDGWMDIMDSQNFGCPSLFTNPYVNTMISEPFWTFVGHHPQLASMGYSPVGISHKRDQSAPIPPNMVQCVPIWRNMA